MFRYYYYYLRGRCSAMVDIWRTEELNLSSFLLANRLSI